MALPAVLSLASLPLLAYHEDLEARANQAYDVDLEANTDEPFSEDDSESKPKSPVAERQAGIGMTRLNVTRQRGKKASV